MDIESKADYVHKLITEYLPRYLHELDAIEDRQGEGDIEQHKAKAENLYFSIKNIIEVIKP